MSGVYISYPFCNQKCSFCNFASDVYRPEKRPLYEAALLEELRAQQWTWHPDTLYFGGGTPSLMDGTVLADMMGSLPTDRLREVTMECAPGTINAETVAHWVALGINRVSLGVQSFDEAELRHTGRRHSAATVAGDIATLRNQGIENISVDLIAGLPHQTRETWQSSLDWTERLAVPHASVYIFEIDEDSRLGQEILLGGKRYSAAFLPGEDLAAELYQTAVDRLRDAGLGRYEISNFARPGCESLHNLKYWQLQPYLGFGLDAHSFDNGLRWSNPDDLDEYLGRTECGSDREPSHPQEEHFFVGLRMMNGIQPSPEEWQLFAEPIRKWQQAGMLQCDGDTLRLSDAGVLVSNEIFQEFLHV